MSEKNPVFQETMQKAWQDFTNKDLFNLSQDRIYLIISDLKTDEKRHLKTLCNWAKVKSTAADFINEAKRIAVKKKYLTLFRIVLGLGKGSELTDEELFAFFKCFDVLEFDFDEVASTAKTSFLSIIEHSKQDSCSLLPIQIWNEVFAFVSHADNKGGSFDKSNLPSYLISYFRPAYYASLQRRLTGIAKQSIEILEAIPDRIGSVSLLRTSYQESVIKEVSEKKFAIITGEPGTGKSIIAKHFIETIQHSRNGFLIVFRADELASINLRDYFHKLDIQLSITEIFQFFPLHTSHYIYIDALEKLNESEGIAFRQLLKATEPFPNIKIIATCRQTEFSLIQFNYLITYSFAPVEVRVLNDEELHDIGEKLPALVPVIENKRLLSLVRFPKYLDFTYKALQNATINFEGIDEQQFVQQLWDVIIENKIIANREGLPARRKQLFIEIAVRRAKQMVPFVLLPLSDAYALSELEKDGVILKSKHYQDAYAPAHDILEDWALVRYAETVYQTNTTPATFFLALGEEPSMRRAYRLWTIQILQHGLFRQKAFFSTIIKDATLPPFWADESIIALLYSPYLGIFLKDNIELLHSNEWVVFTKLIHIMRTACREMGEMTETKDKRYLPVGNCWQQIFQFILDHTENLPSKHYDLILYTLNDWRSILYSASKKAEPTGVPGRIVKWLLDNYYVNIEPYVDREKVKLCLRILFNCCNGMLDEVKQLLEDAMPKENRSRGTAERKTIKFNEEIVELALDGLASPQLTKYCPEVLLKLMKAEWYYIPPVRKKGESEWEWLSRNTPSSTDNNIPFGVTSQYKLDYFPASAFQTPIYWLLKYHPKTTIAFIIDLLNHSIKVFLKSKYASSDKREKLTLRLPSGVNIYQDGSSGLWSMFRGTGIATPYLLQSVLMALEKFLLETAEGGLFQKEFLQGIIEELITKSKTVALTAVVASVAQAYPSMVGKWVVPLFSHRKLISWDSSRYIGDFHPVNPFPLMSDRAFWEERNISNKLPHRLKINPGLKGFIVEYCFNIREYNEEIFALLDQLKKESKKDDWEWKKILTEMDVREWEVTKTEKTDDSVHYQIEPIYKGELKKEVQKIQAEGEIFLEERSNANWLLEVFEGKRNANIDKWRKIVDGYKKIQAFDPMHDHPGTAAAVGIRFFWSELLIDEKQWCFDIVLSIAYHLLRQEVNHGYPSFDVSIHDDDSVMVALALLLDRDNINIDEYMSTLVGFLIATVSNNTLWYNRLLETFSTTIWVAQPNRVNRLWEALILYAPLEKENPTLRLRHASEEELQQYKAKETALRQSFVENKLEINFIEVNLSEYSQWTLLKAVKMIPVENCPENCVKYLLRLVDLYIQQKINWQPKHSRDEDYEEEFLDDFNPHLKNEMEDKIAKIILWNAHSVGKLLFIELMKRYYESGIIDAERRQNRGTPTSLLRAILKQIIYTVDRNLPKNDDLKTRHTTTCFQTIWKAYLGICLQKDTILCGDLFFLNIDWNDDARQWEPLNNFESFFKDAISLMGNIFITAVVNLLSHIGEKSLLETCFPILWQHIQEKPKPYPLLLIPHINQLVSRIFNYHSEVLAEDSLFKEAFLQLLDELVKEGSSDAYWIREKIISYRQVVQSN